MDRQRNGWPYTDRETADGQTERYRKETCRRMGREKDRCLFKERWRTNRQLDGWIDGQAEKQMDGQTERQTNREIVELKYVQID